MDRRQFLYNVAQTAPALALGGAWLQSAQADPPAAIPAPTYVLPEHLPQKMSIGMFIWSWITNATEGEPYYDLEKAVAGLRERGFNAVRADAGLNWCFTMDGQPRGEMEFGPWIPGYRDNLSTVNAVGGGRHDVLKRVVQLMKLAKQYGVYVILTSWEYQDSSWLVADPKIRAEVMNFPDEKRFMHLAQQHDRLLRILKDEGLHKNIAFIEVHNEPDSSFFPQGEQGKKLHEEAIAFLRDRHGDVLVSADCTEHNPAHVPDNTQVYDQHTYTGGIYWDVLLPQTVWNKDFDRDNPKKNELLRRLLKDPFVPYAEFAKPAENVREMWRTVDWLYYNLNNEAFDAWALEQYRQDEAKIKARAVKIFEDDGQEAARRKIPAVSDEGGYFYPPLNSKFELTEPGTSLFDLEVDLAIQHGYWGMMPTTYCGPEHPLWANVAWLRTINERFQTGKILNS
jgi:hypothetical protein